LVGTGYFLWDPMRRKTVQLKLASTLPLSSQTCTAAASESIAPESSEARKPTVALTGIWGSFLHTYNWLNTKLGTTTLGQRAYKSEKMRGLLKEFWGQRDVEAADLKSWITTPQDRVMLLTGHRGNSLGPFVRQVVGNQAIYIDVTDMLEAGGSADDGAFVRQLCRAIGYWPPPLADRQLTAVLDLMLPGSGKLSRESEVIGAVQRMFSIVSEALIDWKNRRSPESSDAAAPLFVIDGFSAENKDKRERFFETLVTWAAYVSEAQLGRVLFIADDSFAEPAMLAALGDRPENLDVYTIADADRQCVRRILLNNLGPNAEETLTKGELDAVGGRFRDITALIASANGGMKPKDALRQLIDSSVVTVRTLLIVGQPGAKWTRPQLWRAVRLLASNGDEPVPYDVFLWSVFRGDEAALRSLIHSNLITMVRERQHQEGLPRIEVKVMPASPLYGEVYRELIQNEGLAAVLDLEVAKEDIKRERATCDSYEVELSRLQEVDDVRHFKGRSLQDPNDALRKRKEQLLALILEQHKKLEKYHQARRNAMAVLQRRKEEFDLLKYTELPK